MIERLIDIAAREHGFDRVALRRRNLIPPTALPYANPLGITYDNGDYRRGRWTARWRSPTGRASSSAAPKRSKRGKLRGIGLAQLPRDAPAARRASAPRSPCSREGRVDVVVGTLSSGQGHETSFAQCVGEWLGVPFDDVRLDRRATPTSCRSAAARIPAARCGWPASSWARRRDADHRQGQAASPRTCSRPPRPTSPSPTAASPSRAPTARSACSRSRARRANGNDLPEELRGPLAADCDEIITRRAAFPTARSLRGRDRSARPARSRSCATPRSTMSAAPSIR